MDNLEMQVGCTRSQSVRIQNNADTVECERVEMAMVCDTVCRKIDPNNFMQAWNNSNMSDRNLWRTEITEELQSMLDCMVYNQHK